jgi:toluene monooxygenase system protein D
VSTGVSNAPHKKQGAPGVPEGGNVTNVGEALANNLVGPIVRAGDVAQAVVEAAEVDNPSKEIRVEDRLAYLRIQTEGRMVLKRKTIEEMLGRPFRMSEFEINLSSFAGQIEMGDDEVHFYLNIKI